MHDTGHLDVIELRLSHERYRLRTAKTERERAYREHSVRMIEQEREGEIAFLAKHGIVITDPPAMTIDEILADLDGLEATLTARAS